MKLETKAEVNGQIVHVEFPSADFERSSGFYSALFGWRSDAEQAGGHLGVNVPGLVQSSWVRTALAYSCAPVVFVAVADLAATLSEARRLGGRVLVPKMNLAGRGTFALLADPDGNVVAVTSSSTVDTGEASVATPSERSQPAPAASSATSVTEPETGAPRPPKPQAAAASKGVAGTKPKAKAKPKR